MRIACIKTLGRLALHMGTSNDLEELVAQMLAGDEVCQVFVTARSAPDQAGNSQRLAERISSTSEPLPAGWAQSLLETPGVTFIFIDAWDRQSPVAVAGFIPQTLFAKEGEEEETAW